MTIGRVGAYLIGSRRAIEEAAATPGTVWVGLLFVLSAGLAREYDGEDLLREPWHLLLPAAASLLSSFLLFVMVVLARPHRSHPDVGFFHQYRSFLGLFWLTAPLAWLYGIPVERFLSAEEATRVNLLLLGAVALWRVLLMTRVVSVVARARLLPAFFVVMFFADSVALVVLQVMPVPVVSLMGGVRLSPSEQLIQDVTLSVCTLGMMTWPLWLITAMAVVLGKAARWGPLQLSIDRSRPVGTRVWLLGILAVSAWAAPLPWTQAEQRLRSEVEEALRSGRVAAGVRWMSQHEPGDFPPHWDPPPRYGYGERSPDALRVLEVAVAEGAPLWVRELYVEKVLDRGGLRDEEIERLFHLLETMPDGASLAGRHHEAIESLHATRGQRAEQRRERLESRGTGP